MSLSASLFGLCLLFTLSSATVLNLGNIDNGDMGCFNSFDDNNNGFDVCLFGLAGGALFFLVAIPLFGLATALDQNTNYANKYYRRESANGPVTFRNPVENMRAASARAGGHMSRMVNKIARFWRARLVNNGLPDRQQPNFPYQEAQHQSVAAPPAQK